ncbi:MAG: hypothetical protein PHS44_06045 [Candidatus Dojkabacteria bacterium]|nr:hypothetical protein [Candidatus Dojkabacteria bacterium]
MKQRLRQLFKKVIANLSYKVYKKHNLNVILITGWAGTSVVRELVYHLLKPSERVRRNTTEVWWDMSVPLSILGYVDKKRTLFQWFLLIIRASLSLMFKPRYQHTLIINLDSSIEDTAKFWSSAVIPSVVVALKERPESKVLSKLLTRDDIENSTFIYDPTEKHLVDLKLTNKFTYGLHDTDVIYQRKDSLFHIRYRSKSLSIEIPLRSKFIWEFVIPAFAVGIEQGIALKQLGDRLTSFDYHPNQVERAVSNLKKFVHEDE